MEQGMRKESPLETKRTVFIKQCLEAEHYQEVSETWVLKKQIEYKLLAFERKILRRIVGGTARPDETRSRKTNEE
jgi:hypothetical protein